MHLPHLKDEIAPVLTVQNVAQYLRLSSSTVYRLLKGKELPAFKIGSEWRFNLESIDRWRAAAEQKLERATTRKRSPGK